MNVIVVIAIFAPVVFTASSDGFMIWLVRRILLFFHSFPVSFLTSDEKLNDLSYFIFVWLR